MPNSDKKPAKVSKGRRTRRRSGKGATNGTGRPVSAGGTARTSAQAPVRPAPTRATEGRGKYVYCIIRTKDPSRFGAIGLGREPAEVHTINYKDIAAVVSDTPLEVYDATRENVLAHERVNDTVMRQHTVIPMSFGTVFKTREDTIERCAAPTMRSMMCRRRWRISSNSA